MYKTVDDSVKSSSPIIGTGKQIGKSNNVGITNFRMVITKPPVLMKINATYEVEFGIRSET